MVTANYNEKGEHFLLNKIETGTLMDFTYKGAKMKGVLVSRSEGNLNIKLLSGYNLLVPDHSISDIKSVETIAQYEGPEEKNLILEQGSKKVAFIGTGGTIASRVDYITGAVKPVLNPGFLRESVSNLSKFTLDISLLEAVLSENITPEDWILFARTVKDKLSKNHGAVILHGTDTMSYTASALSFMFQSLSGPVVLIGSQRSSDRPSSDAFLNLEAGLEFASSNFGEVGIAMHQNTSDNAVALHRGVRSRKMHSSRRDAFRTIGGNPMGKYQNGSVTMSPEAKALSDETVLLDKLETSVALAYFHPGLTADDFAAITEKKRATVIMGTGLGHTGTRLYPVIKEIVERGDHVLMTTQCLFGGVNMNVYSTGRELLKLGVTPLSNMLPEVAMIKTMHVLANYPEEEFRMIMSSNLRGEIVDREFLWEAP